MTEPARCNRSHGRALRPGQVEHLGFGSLTMQGTKAIREFVDLGLADNAALPLAPAGVHMEADLLSQP